MSLNSLAPRTNRQPREKLLARGAESLDDPELLAVLLGTGLPGRPVLQLAEDLLQEFGSLSALFSAPLEQLRDAAGIGKARVALFQSVREISRRASREALSERPLISKGDKVSDFLIERLGGLPFEIFAVMFLDSRHRLIRYESMFQGTVTQTSVYPREIARRSLQLNASAIIAAHNHPSGVAEASLADQLLTSQLRRSLALLDIELLDHLIVAGGRTISAGSV
jgi:DNA repair protein RadC